MNDYIRKAVGLAREWVMAGSFVVTPIEDVDLFHADNLPPMQLDALAAQLVRQVDALGPLECDITAVTTWIYCPSNDDASHQPIIGPDRTMNTIKAIVDSGVLE